jgi:urocanate hydratase
MIAESPDVFVKKVKESLVRHVKAINKHTERGTYFFDYGNAFLLESSRAEADIWANHGISFKYPSYVQDILGPCALIMALVLSDGYVPLEKKKIY